MIKFNRRVGLVLAAAILLGGVMVWMFSRPRTDDTWEDLQLSGEMRVGIDASYPPFETLDESGQIVGFDVDFAKELGRRLDLDVEFVNIAYDGLYDAMLAERVDVLISALADQPQATGKALFTLPYFNAGDALVVRVDSDISSMEDLSGRVLAVEYGSGGDVEARKWQRRLADLEVMRLSDPAAALDAVLSGQADAAVVDGIAARIGVGQHPELAWAGHVNDTLFAIATPSEDEELRKRLNKLIQDLLKDGTISRLMTSWFGPQRDAPSN
jgi:arginine/lysine/histidine transporter system substrate-binding protein